MAGGAGCVPVVLVAILLPFPGIAVVLHVQKLQTSTLLVLHQIALLPAGADDKLDIVDLEVCPVDIPDRGAGAGSVTLPLLHRLLEDRTFRGAGDLAVPGV